VVCRSAVQTVQCFRSLQVAAYTLSSLLCLTMCITSIGNPTPLRPIYLGSKLASITMVLCVVDPAGPLSLSANLSYLPKN